MGGMREGLGLRCFLDTTDGHRSPEAPASRFQTGLVQGISRSLKGRALASETGDQAADLLVTLPSILETGLTAFLADLRREGSGLEARDDVASLGRV